MKDRLLISDGPNARRYEIVDAAGVQAVEFVTDGVNGNTPDATAIANLADWSEHGEGRFTLRRLASPSGGFPQTLATAEHGAVFEQPKPRVVLGPLDGPEGNVFVIIGTCRRALRKSGASREQVEAFVAEAMSQRGYQEVLDLVRERFDARVLVLDLTEPL